MLLAGGCGGWGLDGCDWGAGWGRYCCCCCLAVLSAALFFLLLSAYTYACHLCFPYEFAVMQRHCYLHSLKLKDSRTLTSDEVRAACPPTLNCANPPVAGSCRGLTPVEAEKALEGAGAGALQRGRLLPRPPAIAGHIGRRAFHQLSSYMVCLLPREWHRRQPGLAPAKSAQPQGARCNEDDRGGKMHKR